MRIRKEDVMKYYIMVKKITTFPYNLVVSGKLPTFKSRRLYRYRGLLDKFDFENWGEYDPPRFTYLQSNVEWVEYDSFENEDSSLIELNQYRIDGYNYKIENTSFNKDKVYIYVNYAIEKTTVDCEKEDEEYKQYIERVKAFNNKLSQLNEEYSEFKRNKKWFQFWKKFDEPIEITID